jgi:hypothetical protein
MRISAIRCQTSGLSRPIADCLTGAPPTEQQINRPDPDLTIAEGGRAP